MVSNKVEKRFRVLACELSFALPDSRGEERLSGRCQNIKIHDRFESAGSPIICRAHLKIILVSKSPEIHFK